MTNVNNYGIAKKPFLMVIFILFLSQLNAQNQSFGGGIGINSLFSNGVNLPQNKAFRIGTGSNTKKAFSKPQMSLNIDYNFPTSVSNKWLKIIYNPLFDNTHFRLRGQAALNQYRISEGKNNSLLSFGGSVLYFPLGYNLDKKMNVFVETGYKAAFNNGALKPFHCLVAGVGTRHNMGNDWILQTNLNFTWAMSDYLDQYGVQGFTFKNSDGYALFNVSFLKFFFNKTEKKSLDSGKDSLGMARSFAFQAVQKGQQVIENTKSIQTLIKPLLDKTQSDKSQALVLSETAFAISDKAIWGRLNLKKGTKLDVLERSMDSLKTVANRLANSSRSDYRHANDVRVIEQEMAKKIQELQHALDEAKQSMNRAYQYLPTLKALEKEVQRTNIKEVGEARAIITKIEQAMAAAEREVESAKNSVSETINSFEKADRGMKNALDDIEKTKKEIAALRRH